MTSEEWLEVLDRKAAILKATGTWDKLDSWFEFGAPTEELAKVNWKEHPRYATPNHPSQRP